METNIIFLDIDSVLCLGREINKGCLQNLKSIVDATSARIVLTSSWRFFAKSRAEIESSFKEAKLDPLLGWTGTRGKSRVDKMYYWLKSFDNKTTDEEIMIKKWIAIDDMDLLQPDKKRMQDHFVLTMPEHEITEETVKEVIISLT